MSDSPNNFAPEGHDELDARLRAAVQSVQAPAGLQARLLQIPDEAARAPQYLRRLLPAAAALLVAIGLGLFYEPGLNAALAGEIFGHIYFEEPYFTEAGALPLAEVNARLQPLGKDRLDPQASSAIEVTFAKDCYIAKQRAMHLVVKGETGPVNVMMIPDQIVDHEMQIADRRFNGLVTPASGGTLVVVGNKQEPISATRDRVASSLHWDY